MSLALSKLAERVAFLTVWYAATPESKMLSPSCQVTVFQTKDQSFFKPSCGPGSLMSGSEPIIWRRALGAWTDRHELLTRTVWTHYPAITYKTNVLPRHAAVGDLLQRDC